MDVATVERLVVLDRSVVWIVAALASLLLLGSGMSSWLTAVSVAALGGAGWLLYKKLTEPQGGQGGGAADYEAATAGSGVSLVPQLEWAAGRAGGWVALRWGF